MVRFWIAAVATGMAVAGCHQEDARLLDAHRAVADLLKDPGSAEFKDERVHDNGVVCGDVNSKNEYGGYVGFRPFVYVPPLARKLADRDPVTAHMSYDPVAQENEGDGNARLDYGALYGCGF